MENGIYQKEKKKKDKVFIHYLNMKIGYLNMLMEKDIKLKVVEYIKTPPSLDEIKLIATKLNLRPQEFLRKNDARYKELNLSEFSGSDDNLFEIIIDNPRIMERPIIASSTKAVIGRPPENIFKLFEK